jgi:hypothetical protein
MGDNKAIETDPTEMAPDRIRWRALVNLWVSYLIVASLYGLCSMGLVNIYGILKWLNNSSD